uniref:ubiquitinyl hydrolase 1 n=1 Tax=Molossus molossus TaxID=27622 RepID=A0A7J8BN32_MOLMO|nr:ubiquitin C-terminal hydrolase L5 [Molossus molossus]
MPGSGASWRATPGSSPSSLKDSACPRLDFPLQVAARRRTRGLRGPGLQTRHDLFCQAGACSQDDWISAVRPVIEKRIQKYSEGEIRFNLMAIVSDRKMIYEQKIAELQRQLAEEEPMDTDQGSVLSAIQSEVARNQMLIEEEVQKLKRYKIENIRRKHNYLPFIMELLKTLAEHQQLIPLVEKAKEKQNAKKAQETK